MNAGITSVFRIGLLFGCLACGQFTSWSQPADPEISIRTVRQLAETVLPLVETRGATLEEMLEFARLKFVQFNPAEKEFKIVLQPPVIAPLVLPNDPAPADPRNSAISVSFQNIPLLEYLKCVAGLTRTKFRVNGQTLIFAWESDKGAFLKLYDLADWKLEATRLYRDLRDSRTPMFKTVAAEVARRYATQPDFFSDTSWPLRLATIVAERMQIEAEPINSSVNLLEYSPPPPARQGSPLPAASKSPQEIAKIAMPSVFTIIVADSAGNPVSQGSGFLVRNNRVATNLHVVQVPNADSVFIEGESLAKPVPVAKAPFIDKEADLAVLELASPIGVPLPLGTSGEVGDDVYVIGSPRGLSGTFSSGVVSAYREQGRIVHLQISAPISSGSSGGPVLNRKGEVMGIAVATMKGWQNLNFAVPIEYLRALMDGRTAR